MFNVWDASVNEGICAARRLDLDVLVAPLIQVAASSRQRSI